MADSLANKYRPKTWDDVVEQSTVVEILKKTCEQDELRHRVFLLIGPAGVSKTSLSRIACTTLNGGNGTTIEMDAASHSGADNMREIASQASKYPIGSKYKIFIIDEIHSMSTQAFNVALKLFEEPPAKSVFFLCTTNPEKIPATILSRVQTFQLSKISVDGIYNRLLYVLDSEIAEGRSIKYDNDAVLYIAKLALGGMRDALTLLDTALSYSLELTSKSIETALGLPAYDAYFSLLRQLSKKDNKGVISTIHTVYNSGVNYVQWFDGFHAFLLNVVKYVYLQDITQTMIPSHYLPDIQGYTTTHSNICLQLANVVVKLNQELRTSQYQQELTLTYLCKQDKPATIKQA